MSLHKRVILRIDRLELDLFRMSNEVRSREYKDALLALLQSAQALNKQADELLGGMSQPDEIPEEVRERTVYPFATLGVGEHFTITDKSALPSLRASASAFGKRNGVRMIVRLQKDGTARCHRIE